MCIAAETFMCHFHDRRGREYPLALPYGTVADLLEFTFAPGGDMTGVAGSTFVPAGAFEAEGIDVYAVEVVAHLPTFE